MQVFCPYCKDKIVIFEPEVKPSYQCSCSYIYVTNSYEIELVLKNTEESVWISTSDLSHNKCEYKLYSNFLKYFKIKTFFKNNKVVFDSEKIIKIIKVNCLIG